MCRISTNIGNGRLFTRRCSVINYRVVHFLGNNRVANRQHNHEFIKHRSVFRFLLVDRVRGDAHGSPLFDILDQFATALAHTLLFVDNGNW